MNLSRSISDACSDGPDGKIVASLIEQMKRPENGAVKLDEWAYFADVSKFRLTEAFRTLTGIPPMTFHNAEKLEISKRLLVLEGLSVTETCFEIGFESLGSFTSKFTSQVGLPPGKYAKIMCDTGFVEMFSGVLKAAVTQKPNAKARTRLRFNRPIWSGSIGLVAASFRRPYPSGYPEIWRYIHPLRTRIDIPHDGRGFCLVASMPARPSFEELINLRPALIGRVALSTCDGEKCVPLEAPTVFSPPITLAVPALFCREVTAPQQSAHSQFSRSG